MPALQRRLSAERAEEIRRRHAEGHGVRQIAREMEVDPSTVSRVVNRQLWIGRLRDRLREAEEKIERQEDTIAALRRELERGPFEENVG
jgi:DNA invertase Pin-like site-specific DNA recombinase